VIVLDPDHNLPCVLCEIRIAGLLHLLLDFENHSDGDEVWTQQFGSSEFDFANGVSAADSCVRGWKDL
jgi:hypothetical protein